MISALTLSFFKTLIIVAGRTNPMLHSALRWVIRSNIYNSRAAIAIKMQN